MAASDPQARLLRAQVEGKLSSIRRDSSLVHPAAIRETDPKEGSDVGLFYPEEWDKISELGGVFVSDTPNSALFEAYSDGAKSRVVDYLRGLAEDSPFRNLRINSWGPEPSEDGLKWNIRVRNDIR